MSPPGQRSVAPGTLIIAEHAQGFPTETIPSISYDQFEEEKTPWFEFPSLRGQDVSGYLGIVVACTTPMGYLPYRSATDADRDLRVRMLYVVFPSGGGWISPARVVGEANGPG